jgi:hypothetical protein
VKAVHTALKLVNIDEMFDEFSVNKSLLQSIVDNKTKKAVGSVLGTMGNCTSKLDHCRVWYALTTWKQCIPRRNFFL